MRKKIVQLIREVTPYWAEVLADYLLKNGVTIPVRCKDCAHFHQYHQGKTNELCEWGKCKLINMDVDMPENGFCSYGERRTDEAL